MSVEQLVRRNLGSELVARVETENDTDRDGNAILRVRVYFDESHGQLNLADMLELPGEIRNLNLSGTETGYPVISYVDVRDAPELHAAE